MSCKYNRTNRDRLVVNEKLFIDSGPSCSFLTNKLGQTESVSLKALGDLEFDGDGKYF